MSVTNTKTIYTDYQSTFDQLPGYIAGLPSYPRNFSRDVILAGIISMNEDMLETQIRMSAAHMGMKDDALTGEEPGKVHHEYPGVRLEGRGKYLTTYNACDTTALFLMAIEALGEDDRGRYKEIISTYQRQIILAVAYLLTHVSGNIFYEFPPGGADRFCLRVTYWKDSIIPDQSGREELEYPVAYALAHFMAARGLASAATILSRNELDDVADTMFRTGIEVFMKQSSFLVAQAQGVNLYQISSDELHCLAYIPIKFKKLLPLVSIKLRADLLVTNAGIACTPKAVADSLKDKYHGYVVWPFEQALIHYGCSKFGLAKLAATSERVMPFIEHGNELLEILPEIKQAGNDRQLWSVAAGEYFAGISVLRTNNWL